MPHPEADPFVSLQDVRVSYKQISDFIYSLGSPAIDGIREVDIVPAEPLRTEEDVSYMSLARFDRTSEENRDEGLVARVSVAHKGYFPSLGNLLTSYNFYRIDGEVTVEKAFHPIDDTEAPLLHAEEPQVTTEEADDLRVDADMGEVHKKELSTLVRAILNSVVLAPDHEIE